jgi:hypothetical protein
VTARGNGPTGFLGQNSATTPRSKVQFEHHCFKWCMAGRRRPSVPSLRAKRAFRQYRLRCNSEMSFCRRSGSDSNKHNNSTSTTTTASNKRSRLPSANGFGYACSTGRWPLLTSRVTPSLVRSSMCRSSSSNRSGMWRIGCNYRRAPSSMMFSTLGCSNHSKVSHQLRHRPSLQFITIGSV